LSRSGDSGGDRLKYKKNIIFTGNLAQNPRINSS
jgi:hypothetical protein